MSTRGRRLSAILHADLTGFTRLMEGGEERTVSHLKSVHDEIWRPAIEMGGGSVVDLAGATEDDAAFGAALWQACREKASSRVWTCMSTV